MRRGVSSSNSSNCDSSTIRRISLTSSGVRSGESLIPSASTLRPVMVAVISAIALPATACGRGLLLHTVSGRLWRMKSSPTCAVDRPLDVLRLPVVRLDATPELGQPADLLVAQARLRAQLLGHVARDRRRGRRVCDDLGRLRADLAAHDLARHLRDEERVGRDLAADDARRRGRSSRRSRSTSDRPRRD